MNPEDIFLEQIGTIDRINSYICRRNRLDANEAEDFGQFVKMELIDNNYEIIRKFEGRASITTYLTTVIQHLFYQYRVRLWGKWRPSAEARRIGDKAVTLERLIYREGYSLEEAVQVLITGHDSEYTRRELEAIWLRLPVRPPRPVLVSQAVPPEVATEETDADERLMAGERQDIARNVMSIVDETMESMSPEDQVILQLRFWDGLKAAEIAQRLGIPAKRVYKRVDRQLAVLKAGLARAGVSRQVMDELLSHDDAEIRMELLHQVGGKSEARPSNRADGVGGGAGRLSGWMRWSTPVSRRTRR